MRVFILSQVHRKAYNAAFAHFNVRCGDNLVVWSEEFYNELQNTVKGPRLSLLAPFPPSCALLTSYLCPLSPLHAWR